MLKEAFEWIKKETTELTTLVVHGKTYSNKSLYLMEPANPTLLRTSTLVGFCDFVNNNENVESVEIINPWCIAAKEAECAGYRNRYLLSECVPQETKTFDFNHYMSVERLVIQLHSLFEAESADREKLTKSISTICSSEIITSDDDGFSQIVTRKSGIKKVDNETVNPFFMLQPYRTFLEIEQPSSLFLLRLRKSKYEDGEIEAGLFETDGGMWKLDAMIKIKNFLHNQISAKQKVNIYM